MPGFCRGDRPVARFSGIPANSGQQTAVQAANRGTYLSPARSERKRLFRTGPEHNPTFILSSLNAPPAGVPCRNTRPMLHIATYPLFFRVNFPITPYETTIYFRTQRSDASRGTSCELHSETLRPADWLPSLYITFLFSTVCRPPPPPPPRHRHGFCVYSRALPPVHDARCRFFNAGNASHSPTYQERN